MTRRPPPRLKVEGARTGFGVFVLGTLSFLLHENGSGRAMKC
jgi:hypothetical protein